MKDQKSSILSRLKSIIIGEAKNPFEPGVFHKLSLIAFFAWIGLGVDGLTSSCYGPEEAFLSLGSHRHLGLFVGLASALTIIIISTSYSQLIELFPTGGGGFIVASKLLNPTLGAISGCALIIDYVLTIALSIASGSDALFSFLPVAWLKYKLLFAALGVIMIMVMNLRGVKESVMTLMPIFIIFVLTHAFVIIYSLSVHAANFSELAKTTITEVSKTQAELGFFGMIFLILKAYSMGAGTFTGIEATSNGIPILRDPKVETARRTMIYMAASLSIVVVGLIISYTFYGVDIQPGKTLNAVLFARITQGWQGNWGNIFVWVTLFSEAALLFVAAQTGFIDGPRVLANMAISRCAPHRFAHLSDRLVNQNGIILMGGAALILLLLSQGSVRFMVVLYSINVFITFTLSQLGMVRFWWLAKEKKAKNWKYKLLVNGMGLALSAFILAMVSILKFHEGGWITLFVTGIMVSIVLLIRKHYMTTAKLIRNLDKSVQDYYLKYLEVIAKYQSPEAKYNPEAKTAVIFVSGFNSIGILSFINVIQMFGGAFRNFVFVEIGNIDAGSFRGQEEVERLKKHVKSEVETYVDYVKGRGFHAEGIFSCGTDITTEVEQVMKKILEKYPEAVFFASQLVLPDETIFTKWLHNYTVFALQRIFYRKGHPFVLLPVTQN